jgi:hypothetical protein
MPGETLRQLVQSRLDELGLSAYQAGTQSKLISYEVLNMIVKGKHSGRLQDRVARGLAETLRVPLERVLASVGQETHGPWEWPTRFERLRPEHREIVESVAGGFLAAYDRKEG